MSADPIAMLVRLACGVSVRRPGCPLDARPRVYFANHTSHLDFPVLWASLPAAVRRRTRPVAAAVYWSVRGLRRFAAGLFRPVLVDRRDRGGDAAVATMAEALDCGDSLVLFPEGTRSIDGEVARFRGGLHALGRLRPDLDLVPVYLKNLGRMLPKGALLPVPLVAAVRFGPPLRVTEGEEKGAFLERARLALLDLEGDQP